MKFYQGKFVPKHPEKYVGNPKNIIHRSGLEKRFFKFFDEDPRIKNWASEEFYIPYFSPIDKKWHRYFVDNVIRTDKNVFVTEIKPYAQTLKPQAGKNKKRFLAEAETWTINQAKWQAAQEFCRKKKLQFMILTERDLPKILT